MGGRSSSFLLARSSSLLLAAASALAAPGSSGCGPRLVVIAPPGDEAEVVVIVRAGPDGTPTGVERVSAAGARVEAGEGELLALFSLERGRFVRWSGGDVAPADLGALDVALRSQTADGGRCFAPALEPPALVTPGDDCALPPFVPGALYRGEGEELGLDFAPLLDRIRREVRLRATRAPGAPGAAACGAGRGSEGALVRCPVHPAGAALLEETLAVAPDGTVGGFSRHSVRSISASGGVIQKESSREGWAGAAAALPGGRFMVAWNLSREGDQIELLGSDLEVAGAVEQGNLRISAFRFLEAGGPLYAIGAEYVGVGGDKPAVFACDAQAATRCSPQPVQPACDFGVDRLNDAVILDNGVGVAMANGGHLMIRAPGASEWRCDGAPRRTVSVPGIGDFPVDSYVRGVALENRLYTCGQVRRSTDPIAVVLTASIGAADIAAAGPALVSRLELVAFQRSSACTDFVVAPGGDRAYWLASRIVELGPDGLVREETPGDAGASAFPEIGQPLIALAGSHGGDWMVARSRSGGLWKRGAGGRFEHLIGPRDDEDGVFRALAPAGARAIVAIEDRGRALGVSLGTGAGCDALETSSVAAGADPQIVLDGEVDAAVRLTAPEPRVLYAIRRGRGAALVELDVATGSSIDRGDAGGGRILDMAEIAPGRVVAVSSEGKLLDLDLRGAIPVVREIERLVSGWRTVDAANGVAWAGGRGVLGRILPNAGGTLRVETSWLSRPEAAEFASLPRREPADITALRSPCADRVVFAARENALVSSLDTSAWRVRATGDAAAPFAVEPVAGYRELTAIEASTPAAVLGDAEPLSIVLESGVVIRDEKRTTLDIEEVRGAVASGRLLLFGGDAGRLQALIEP